MVDLYSKCEKLMYEPTSSRDLLDMLDNKVNIVTYDELKNIQSFQQLMEPYQSAIILYPNYADPNIGHWICVFVQPGMNRVQYFDSYGCFIDDPILEFNKDVKKDDTIQYPSTRNKLEPLLVKLLLDSPYKDSVYFNETPFQDLDKGTSTCGLWCVIRIKENHMSENEFKKLYYDYPLEHDILPDILITGVIYNLFS